jgi:hypothetical protein
MRSREKEGGENLEKDVLGAELKEDDYNELDGEDLEGFSIKEEDDEFSDELDEEDDLLGDDSNDEEEEEVF